MVLCTLDCLVVVVRTECTMWSVERGAWSWSSKPRFPICGSRTGFVYPTGSGEEDRRHLQCAQCREGVLVWPPCGQLCVVFMKLPLDTSPGRI